MEKIFLAGVILEDDCGRIDFQLRDDNPKIVNPGMWSVFGGHIDEMKSVVLGEGQTWKGVNQPK